MLLDGIHLTDTSTVTNFVLERGLNLPDSSKSREGELFYQENVGLFVYSGSEWIHLDKNNVDSVNSKKGDVVLTTSDITEGNNQYFTTARARSAISASGGNVNYNVNTGVLTFTLPNTDNISEGTKNLYFTNARAQKAFSVTGDNGLTYNSTTGVFTYNAPNTDAVNEGTSNMYFTNTRARAALSAGANISYDPVTGIISATGGGAGGSTNMVTTSFFPGQFSPMTGTIRWYPSAACNLKSVFMSLSTTSTVDVTIDLKKNGTTILGETKPVIPSGNFKSLAIELSVSMSTNDYLTIDILTGNGSDLAVRIEYL